MKSAKKGGQKQFNGLVDVYKQTLASDGIAGLYRGFVISCVGIVIYRGLYFGVYDSIKPSLPATMKDNLLVNFLVHIQLTQSEEEWWWLQDKDKNTTDQSIAQEKSLLQRVSSHFSRVLEPTF